MSFKIIEMELPSRSTGYTKSARSQFTRMLLKLKPGQAYVHEVPDTVSKDELKKIHARLSARLHGVTRRYGVKFSTRRVDGGIGVWKHEEDEG